VVSPFFSFSTGRLWSRRIRAAQGGGGAAQEGLGATGSRPDREEETRRRGPDSTKRADGSMEESGGGRWHREGMRWGRGTEVDELMRMGYVDGLTVGGATFG
jgi:hypothetical protein